MLSLKRACRNNILVCIRHFQFPSAINITYRGKKGRGGNYLAAAAAAAGHWFGDDAGVYLCFQQLLVSGQYLTCSQDLKPNIFSW